jgi:hypothetical protein
MKEENQPIPEGPQEQAIQEDPQRQEQIEEEFVQEDQVELGPAQQAQLDAYQDNATLAVFNEEKQPEILQSLQQYDNPIESVAQTAFTIHKQFEAGLGKREEAMTEVTMLLGAAHLVSELILLADAANLYHLEPEQRLEAFRVAVMKYFEAGLKDGSIDPVELQKTIEPLMTQEQKEAGLQMMEKHKMSKTAPPSGQFAKQQQQPQQQPQPMQR